MEEIRLVDLALTRRINSSDCTAAPARSADSSLYSVSQDAVYGGTGAITPAVTDLAR
jgi:hypothetical protein